MVTGGAGYLGAHVGRRLEAAGHEVITRDDLSSGWAAAVSGELIQADIRDRVKLGSSLARGFSAVIHCAGCADVPRSGADPVGT